MVLPVRVDPHGVTGPRWRDAVGPAYRRSSRGRYVEVSVPRTPLQQIGEVGVLLPRLASVTGWASLRWFGGWWFNGSSPGEELFRPVPVAMPRCLLRAQPMFTICAERWNPRETQVVDGLRVATTVRAVCFEMRYAPHPEAAIAALEMAAFHDLVSVEEASDWIDVHPSYTGIEQARVARDLAQENSWSPRELALRTHWPMSTRSLLLNQPVFDLDGRHIGTPDVIDPVTGVCGEYDGELHLTRARRAHDLRREHEFRRHGLEPVAMVADDVGDPRSFSARVMSAYAAAVRRAGDRRWTLDLPQWWVPTFTVAQRRALSGRDRQIWLRHRRPPDDRKVSDLLDNDSA